MDSHGQRHIAVTAQRCLLAWDQPVQPQPEQEQRQGKRPDQAQLHFGVCFLCLLGF